MSRRVATPFLRSRLSPYKNNASLPWRNGEDDPSSSGKSQGRGRGKKEGAAVSSLFDSTTPTDRPFGKKESIADDVLEILSTWNTDQDTKPTTPPPSSTTGARKDTVSEEDIQKLLGTFFSQEKTSKEEEKTPTDGTASLSETPASAGETGLYSDEPLTDSDGFYLGDQPEAESELEFTPNFDPSIEDLDFHPDDLVRDLNSPQTAAEFGKLIGLQHPAPIHVVLTPEPPTSSHDAANEYGDENDALEKREEALKDLRVSREDAEELLPQLHYAFTPEDDRVRSYLQDILHAETDPLEKKNAQKLENLFEKHNQDTENIMQHIEAKSTEKGERHGRFLKQLHQPTEELYEEHRAELDECFSQVCERKSLADPEFKAKHERLTQQWKQDEARIEELTAEFGPDHEQVLLERRKLHNSRIAFVNLFTKEDFDGVEFPVFQEVDSHDLPLHPRYQGEDAEKNFRDDFFNHDVQLLPIAMMDKAIPRDYLPYLESVVNTFSSPAETEASWALTSIPESRYQQIGKGVIHQAIDAVDFEKIRGGTRIDDVVPSKFQSILGTSIAIAEDEYQSAQFRAQLENYMAVQLTTGLRGIRDETQEYYEAAQKMDKLSARARTRRLSHKRAMMRRRSKLEEKFGQPFVRKQSIIARAIAAKGIVDQEDILDQALEILRKEGRRFTHRDIPAIRQQNFQEKFKAIFHNGSIPPMEKAHLVARAISNFIISADELKIMDGALEIFSTEPTELEIQERKAELQRERLTVNYDNSTMSFTGLDGDLEFEDEEAEVDASSENKQVFEGYHTSDFETESDAEFTEPMPEDFVRLKQFKDNAEATEAWAYAVDIPLSALRGDGASETQSAALEKIAKEVDATMEDSDRDPETPKKK